MGVASAWRSPCRLSCRCPHTLGYSWLTMFRKCKNSLDLKGLRPFSHPGRKRWGLPCKDKAQFLSAILWEVVPGTGTENWGVWSLRCRKKSDLMLSMSPLVRPATDLDSLLGPDFAYIISNTQVYPWQKWARKEEKEMKGKLPQFCVSCVHHLPSSLNNP